MKKILLFIFACISLVSLNSYAFYNRANSATFTVGTGYDYLSSKRHMKNNNVNFVALGYNITDHWGVEGLLGFINTRFKPGYENDRQVNGDIFAVDVLYHFLPCCKVQPYVLAGVGIIGLKPNRFDAINEGNINAGIGLQYFVDEVVSFRAEARDFYTTPGGKNDFMIDAGVTFYLHLC